MDGVSYVVHAYSGQQNKSIVRTLPLQRPPRKFRWSMATAVYDNRRESLAVYRSVNRQVLWLTAVVDVREVTKQKALN